jgi:hypothetical protein
VALIDVARDQGRHINEWWASNPGVEALWTSVLRSSHKLLRATIRTLRMTGERDYILTVMGIASVTDVFHGLSVEP